jgi:hypothetical protein
MASNNTIKNRFFRIAGYIHPSAFTKDEIRFRGHECTAGRDFLREIRDRSWVDLSHEPASCDWKDATPI